MTPTKVWLACSAPGHHLDVHYVFATKAAAENWLAQTAPATRKRRRFQEILDQRFGEFWRQSLDVGDNRLKAEEALFFWDKPQYWFEDEMQYHIQETVVHASWQTTKEKE